MQVNNQMQNKNFEMKKGLRQLYEIIFCLFSQKMRFVRCRLSQEHATHPIRSISTVRKRKPAKSLSMEAAEEMQTTSTRRKSVKNVAPIERN